MATLRTFQQGLALLTRSPNLLTRQTPVALRSRARCCSSYHLPTSKSSAVPSSRLGSSSYSTSSSPVSPEPSQPQKKLSFQSEPKLQITFTCTVTDCNTRSSHEFTKRSYTRGIVIVQCPGCKNRYVWHRSEFCKGILTNFAIISHLIADHLGWFKDSTEDGKLKTVEDLVKAKGEKVRRGRVDGSGDIEYAPEE